MLMYNLIEYGDNYSKTFVSLWQYYRNDQLFVEKNETCKQFVCGKSKK